MRMRTKKWRRTRKREKRTSQRTARDFIGEWTPCTRLRGQISWLHISRLPWRSLRNAPCNSTLSCAFCTLRLPCELVARTEMPMIPPGEATSQEVSFNTSKEAITYCQSHLRQGWWLNSAERDLRKRPRLSHPSCRKRGSSNRKAGAWKMR